MRTPGEDKALAVGLLVTVGLIRQPGDIASTEFITASHALQPNAANTMAVQLRRGITRACEPMPRRGQIHSSCGVCAATDPDDIHMPSTPSPLDSPTIFQAEIVQRMIGQLREQQTLFQATGGLHAASLGNTHGEIIATHEDIGRHNALDKLIGQQFLADELPLSEHILLVSGRTSYEIVHKASMAGIRSIVGVGAASSLAVEYASKAQMTLAGFAKKDRLTIYTGEQYLLKATT